MTFLGDAVVTYLVRLMAVALSAATNIIIARELGPEGRGNVAVLLLVPTFLLRLGGLNLGKASIYLTGKKKVSFASAFWATLLAVPVLGSLLILAGFVVYQSPIGERLFQGLSSLEALVALGVFPLFLYMSYLLDLQRAVNHPGMFNWMQFQRFAVSMLVVVALTQSGALTIMGAVVAAAVGVLLAVVTGFFFLIFAERPHLDFDIKSIMASSAPLVSYGAQIQLMSLVNFMDNRLDVFLVKGLIDSEAVGLYMVAVNFAEMLWLLPDSLGVVFLPKVAQMSLERAARFTPLVARAVLVIMTLMALLVFVFARPIVTLLYSDAFAASVLPLRILLVGVVVFSVFKVLNRGLTARGQALALAIPNGVSLMATIGLNLVLIPRLGVAGAAWASTISYVLSTLVVILVYVRRSDTSARALLLWTRKDWKLYRRLTVDLLNRFSNPLSRKS